MNAQPTLTLISSPNTLSTVTLGPNIDASIPASENDKLNAHLLGCLKDDCCRVARLQNTFDLGCSFGTSAAFRASRNSFVIKALNGSTMVPQDWFHSQKLQQRSVSSWALHQSIASVSLLMWAGKWCGQEYSYAPLHQPLHLKDGLLNQVNMGAKASG